MSKDDFYIPPVKSDVELKGDIMPPSNEKPNFWLEATIFIIFISVFFYIWWWGKLIEAFILLIVGLFLLYWKRKNYLQKNPAVKFYDEGVVLSESGDYEKALAAYNQALTFNDKDPDIWNNKCYVLTKLGKFDEAVKAGNVAVQISPQDPEILDTLCNAYIGCNNREKADECQKKILELKKTSSEIHKKSL